MKRKAYLKKSVTPKVTRASLRKGCNKIWKDSVGNNLKDKQRFFTLLSYCREQKGEDGGGAGMGGKASQFVKLGLWFI